MEALVPKSTFDRLPERYQRRAREIAERVAAIDGLLKPCIREDVRDAAVRMRKQLRPQPDTDPQNMADEFKAACRDLPAWAVHEAANDFLAGRVDNHAGQFMPTCAEFGKRVRSIMLPFLSERSALRTEASRLFERAQDDADRHLIEMERQDPVVRAKVAALTETIMAGATKKLALPPSAANADGKKFDAYRRREPFQSKIDQTKIARG